MSRRGNFQSDHSSYQRRFCPFYHADCIFIAHYGFYDPISCKFFHSIFHAGRWAGVSAKYHWNGGLGNSDHRDSCFDRGIILRRIPNLAYRIEPTFRKLSAVFFVLILIAAVLKERDNLLNYISKVGPMALTLNIATLVIGFFSARLLGLNNKQSSTVSIEAEIQNGTLGITIAATLIGNSQMTIPSAIYGILMFGTAGIIIFLGKKMNNNVENGGHAFKA